MLLASGNKRVLNWAVRFRDVALIGSFLAAVVSAELLGYRTLASLLLWCFFGGVFGWRLWKHHRRGEPLEGVKLHWFAVVLAVLMICFRLNSDRLLGWLLAD